jgi:hypothetical protein
MSKQRSIVTAVTLVTADFFLRCLHRRAAASDRAKNESGVTRVTAVTPPSNLHQYSRSSSFSGICLA